MSTVPYSQHILGLDPAKVIAETPARLLAVLDELSPAALEVPPAPGKWNLREVMCHLADCEIVWAWRLRIAYEMDRAQLQPFEQDPWAKAYSSYTYDAAKATFTAVRAWNVAFISGLTEADKAKRYYHPERGEESLWTLVEIMAGHDLHHLKLLHAK